MTVSTRRFGEYEKAGTEQPCWRKRAEVVVRAAAVALALSPFFTSSANADELFVVTTDFSTGSSSVVDLDSPFGATLDVAPLCPDAVARLQGDEIYVVNRLGCDNIQVLDAETYATLREFSVGPGSNPQDIAFASPNRAYVTRYDSPWLLEIDPTTGARLDSVDLSVMADADGLPEMSRMHFRAPYLYIQIQRLDSNSFYEPVDVSYIGIVDTRDNSVLDLDDDAAGTQGILLQTTNPNGAMDIDITTGDLLVPTSGAFTLVNDGALERIHIQPSQWRNDGFATTGTQLGGDPLHFAIHADGTGYAIVADASFVTCLLRFDLRNGETIGAPVACGSGFDFADCVITAAEGYLYLADRNFIDPGVRVFDASTGAEITSGPIFTGLPPFELIPVRPTTSDVAWESASRSALKVFPNPSPSEVQWSDSPQDLVALGVFDSSGRMIRRLADSAQAWDGNDGSGRPVPSGLYWIRGRQLSGAEVQSPGVRILR